jgi:hypothetical protein
VDHCRTHERVSEAATSKSRGLPRASWDARGHATPRRRILRAGRRGRAQAAAAELGSRRAAPPRPSWGQASYAATPSWGAGELRRHGRAGGRRAAPPRQAGGRRAAPPRPSWGQASCAATPSWGQASCAATPSRAQGWGRVDHGRASRHGRAQSRAGAAAGTPRWASRGPLAGTPHRAGPARRTRGRRGGGVGASAQGPRPHGRAPEAGRAGAAPRRARRAGRRARGANAGPSRGDGRAARRRAMPRARRGRSRPRIGVGTRRARRGRREGGRRGREGGRRGRAHLDDRRGGDPARARGKKGELREVREKWTPRGWRRRTGGDFPRLPGGSCAQRRRPKTVRPHQPDVRVAPTRRGGWAVPSGLPSGPKRGGERGTAARQAGPRQPNGPRRGGGERLGRAELAHNKREEGGEKARPGRAQENQPKITKKGGVSIYSFPILAIIHH